jgi:hypothetical protein
MKVILHAVIVFDNPTISEFSNYLKNNYQNALVSSGYLIGGSINNELPKKYDYVNENDIEYVKCLIKRTENNIDVSGSKNSPAVFILSPPRSGTTLLRVMIGGHEKLISPPDMELLPFENLLDRRKFYSNERNKFRLEGLTRFTMEIYSCDYEHAESIVKEYEEQKLTTKEFYKIIQDRIYPALLIDKTVTNALHLEVMEKAEEYFQNAIYIHLTRHPCGMINSFSEIKLGEVFFPYNHKYTDAKLAEILWTLCHRNIIEFLQKVPKSRQIRVSFETLLNEPETTMRNICRLVDVQYDDQMLKPYKEQKKRMTDPAKKYSRMLGDVKFHSHKIIDKNVAERWRGSINEATIGEPTKGIAKIFGYDI